MSDTAALYLLVGLGSVIGGVLRALVSLAGVVLLGPAFPWGTLFANTLGSFVIGFYATLTGPDGRAFARTRQRQFVMAGICGGFTTFSVFSLETLQFVQAGRRGLAALYVLVSLAAWLGAVAAGHLLARRLNRLGGS